MASRLSELGTGTALVLVLALAGIFVWTFLRRRPVVSPNTSIAPPQIQPSLPPPLRMRQMNDPSDDEPSPMAGIAAVVREARLELKNEELKIILDSVAQGFASVQLDGSLLPERSAILATWLGTMPERMFYWELVEHLESGSGTWAKQAWQQVTEGFLPYEVTLHQLPRRLSRAGQHFELAYHPVLRGEVLQRVVVVVTDVTSEVERQRGLQGQHEFSLLVERLIRDRSGFLEFWKEVNLLIDRVVADSGQDSVQLKRDLHTLKGNLGFFGLTRLAKTCHRLEDTLVEAGADALAPADAAALKAEWDELCSRIEPLIVGSHGTFEVPEAEYVRLLQSARSRVPHEQLVEAIVSLKLQPVRWRLDWAVQHVRRVAETLGKTAPEVRIEEDGLRLAPGRLSAFWSAFVHLLNNVADHGIESDDERLARGKPVPAQLRVSARLSGAELQLEVRDDGPGIDWERLALRAGFAGGAPLEPSDRERLLFSDGVSQRAEVSEFSGRGAGLAAFRSAVVSLKGRIEVSSELGQGTAFRIKLPLQGLEYVRLRPS